MYLTSSSRLFTFFALHNFAFCVFAFGHGWFSVFCFCACCSFKLLFICVWSCRFRFSRVMLFVTKAGLIIHVLVFHHRCLSLGSRLEMKSLKLLITWAHLHLISSECRLKTETCCSLKRLLMCLYMKPGSVRSTFTWLETSNALKWPVKTCYINIQLFVSSLLFVLLEFQGVFLNFAVALLILDYTEICNCSQTCLNSKWNDFIKLFTEMCMEYLCALIYFTQIHQIRSDPNIINLSFRLSSYVSKQI